MQLRKYYSINSVPNTANLILKAVYKTQVENTIQLLNKHTHLLFTVHSKW